ncbi:hypothetical protein V6R21_22785 [Limibacter armeniacum]|uniref:hypothetical protein n=1 Tax=Limibacter armeniacum TaxID=466084 RepID=UPI002FE586E8
MQTSHNFHIPVMGIGFTIDTPIKVAPYGISSVISLVDDKLTEKIGAFHAAKRGLAYPLISDKEKDARARRITQFLNLVHDIVEKKLKHVKETPAERLKYIELLPESSPIKEEYKKLLTSDADEQEFREWAEVNIVAGSIDVNIMTKVDKENFFQNELLPNEYNDAHAALRGFGLSKLNSSIILSAGMNPRLFSYMEAFDDFYPDAEGHIKKKIVLKVSDYRSALIQGKVLAKKGIWVSEYRIESGLNCGGHAFATEGLLMGPILNEFKKGKQALIDTTFDLLSKALDEKGLTCSKAPEMLITAQGGIGTNEEHEFLINEYDLNATGWGTPFLLVPEATNVDKNTINLLTGAKEKDLYLSGISPLGVPFNSLRGNTMDNKKMERINNGRPGSPCPKKYVELNKEFGDKGLCVASRKYQHMKLQELDEKNLSKEEYEKEFFKITEKSCICLGLGTAALLTHNIENKVEGDEVSVCPGPNMAYYNRTMSLKEMVGHIYGRNNVIERTDRPNLFVKELSLYVDYLQNQLAEESTPIPAKKEKYYRNFTKNLMAGIEYYYTILENEQFYFQQEKETILLQLEAYQGRLSQLTDNVIA